MRKAILTSDSPSVLLKKPRIFGGGKRPLLRDLEQDLLERIIEEREIHLCIPCNLIILSALEIAEGHGIKDFQTSRGWLFRFLKRGNLYIRRCTTTGQTIPKHALSKIANFIRFCEKQPERFNFSLVHITNMGETEIWADICPVTRKSKDEIQKLFPSKWLAMAVCLAVKVDGTKIIHKIFETNSSFHVK